ncbi:hypothetical protein, partial [Winogradskyella sp.]|uniref:hypothetical protein n=1 Tax=Winogradskyella sp. TaxID=1883156 RepID=UPI0025D87C86
MKKSALILILITSFTFSQTTEYKVEADKGKKISSLMQFSDNSFTVCTSKQSLGFKSNEPKLIRLD